MRLPRLKGEEEENKDEYIKAAKLNGCFSTKRKEPTTTQMQKYYAGIRQSEYTTNTQQYSKSKFNMIQEIPTQAIQNLK